MAFYDPEAVKTVHKVLDRLLREKGLTVAQLKVRTGIALTAKTDQEIERALVAASVELGCKPYFLRDILTGDIPPTDPVVTHILKRFGKRHYYPRAS